MATKTAVISTTASTCGRSLALVALIASCPSPGRPKTVSVSTAPPISRPKSRPKIVTIGVSADAQAVLDDDGCVSGRPLARAVRM